MGYVRTITYTFPYEKIEHFNNGTELYMRLVAAHKLLCQDSGGLIDTGVWITQQRDGILKVVSYTEWYSLEDLNSFAQNSDVMHHENVITKASLPTVPPSVDIYEVIG